MKVFYLFSETSNPEHEGRRANIQKLPHATKRYCLENFIKCFPTSEITVLADGILPDTLDYLQGLQSEGKIKFRKIFAGSMAKAFRVGLEAIRDLPENEAVMIQEDDYLYLDGAEKAITEALVYGDYVTGYTHPDKWMNPERGGNPFVEQEGVSEITRVIQCPSRFWMITNSTTCTFATTRDTIRADWDDWMEGTKDEVNAQDFQTFIRLRQTKDRLVLMPIPTLSTHTMMDWLAPLQGTGITSWGAV